MFDSLVLDAVIDEFFRQKLWERQRLSSWSEKWKKFQEMRGFCISQHERKLFDFRIKRHRRSSGYSTHFKKASLLPFPVATYRESGGTNCQVGIFPYSWLNKHWNYAILRGNNTLRYGGHGGREVWVCYFCRGIFSKYEGGHTALVHFHKWLQSCRTSGSRFSCIIKERCRITATILLLIVDI